MTEAGTSSASPLARLHPDQQAVELLAQTHSPANPAAQEHSEATPRAREHSEDAPPLQVHSDLRYSIPGQWEPYSRDEGTPVSSASTSERGST